MSSGPKAPIACPSGLSVRGLEACRVSEASLPFVAGGILAMNLPSNLLYLMPCFVRR